MDKSYLTVTYGRMGNRAATEKKILQAVGTLIARSGFRELGINAIAREAGIGKTLIYRYFGGLSPLMRTYARSADFWPDLEELLGGDSAAFLRMSSEEQASTLLRQYIRAIRERRATREIIAWEMVERNQITIILEKKREEVTLELLDFMQGRGLKFPFDMRGIMAVLSSSVNYLAARSRKISVFGGVDIRSEQGWQHLEKYMLSMIHAFYS